MYNESFHKQAYIYLIYALAFLLPLYRMIIPYIIALLILNWLLEGRFRKKITLVKRSKSRSLILLFGSLYVVHLIGLLYTSNLYGPEGGFFDIQVKLSLIVFPMIFASIPDDLFVERTRLGALKSLVAGCTMAILICLFIACYHYWHTGNYEVFFYTRISYFLHPSYFSMYLNFGLAILLYFLFLKAGSIKLLWKFLLVILIICFTSFIVLLSSKAGLIGMYLTYFITVLVLVLWRRMYIKGFGLAGIAIIFILILLKILPFSSVRMSSVRDAVKQANTTVEINNDVSSTVESSAERLLIWQVSWELIKENFLFGTGTGDLKNELVEMYHEKGFAHAAEMRLNAHSQYMQAFVAIGVYGFLTLLLCLLLPLFFAIKTRDYLYLLFLLLVMFNLLVESMLETQAGVVFYAFINILLFSTGYMKANRFKAATADSNK